MQENHTHHFNRVFKSVDIRTGADIIVERCPCGEEKYKSGDNNSPVFFVIPDPNYSVESSGYKSLNKGGRIF